MKRGIKLFLGTAFLLTLVACGKNNNKITSSNNDNDANITSSKTTDGDKITKDNQNMDIFDYYLEGSSYVITGIKDRSVTSIVVPDCVKRIEDNAFYYSSLTSITIGNSVTSIGNYSFYNCRYLTSITIPNSVTSIGDYAFCDCTNLTSITIPNSVISIGIGAFGGCSSLVSITLPFVGDKAHEPSDAYQYPFGYIFGTESYGNRLVQEYYGINTRTIEETAYCIPKSLEEVIITGSSYIQYGSFDRCIYLTSITIPDSITYIGDCSFRNCSSLKSIIIPDSVTYIGDNSFHNCSSLTSITISNGVEFIRENTFSGCSNLKTITIPDSVTSIDDSSFSSCSNLTNIIIPKSVRRIESEAFDRCGLKNVYYGGTQSDWENMYISYSYNTSLINAKIYYYSENIPSKPGCYWHYGDNNEIIKW